jgi:predicted DNA-binding protein (MmcQ/YjbR family)
MNIDQFNQFCATLPAASHIVQWGGAQVWKVGGAKDGKVFAIGGWNKDGALTGITFKVSPLSYDILKEQPGLRPAPYLASRGMKWIQHYDTPGLNNEELRAYLSESHRIVAAGMSKKKQAELGLLPKS